MDYQTMVKDLEEVVGSLVCFVPPRFGMDKSIKCVRKSERAVSALEKIADVLHSSTNTNSAFIKICGIIIEFEEMNFND